MDWLKTIESRVDDVLVNSLKDKISSTERMKLASEITADITGFITPDKLVLADLTAERNAGRERALVSVIGLDSVGIVAAVTAVLAQAGANIEGMNQSVVRGFFALILTVDISSMNCSLADLQEMMDKVASGRGLKIYIQHENIFYSMNRI